MHRSRSQKLLFHYLVLPLSVRGGFWQCVLLCRDRGEGPSWWGSGSRGRCRVSDAVGTGVGARIGDEVGTRVGSGVGTWVLLEVVGDEVGVL